MNEKFSQAKDIVQKLISNNYEAVIVGGAVRDYVMGKTPTDYDIATSAPPEIVEQLFKKTISVGKKFGVILVLSGGNQFEVATFRRDLEYKDGRRPIKVEFADAKEDVLRRDFTINGLFMHPLNFEVIDFVGGVQDIKNKTIRCIGEPFKRFDEDHLRILRALRFASNLDFEIEKDTWSSILELKELLNKISKERIRDEFEKILKRPNSLKGINLLFKSGLSSILFCENFFDNDTKLQNVLNIMLSHNEIISIEQALSLFYISSQKFIVLGEHFSQITVCEDWEKNLDILINHLKKYTFSNKTVNTVRDSIRMIVSIFSKASLSASDIRKALGCEQGNIIYKIVSLINDYYNDNLIIYKKFNEIKSKYEHADILPLPFIAGKDLLDLNIKEGPYFSEILKKMYDIQLNNDKYNKSDLSEILIKEINKRNEI